MHKAQLSILKTLQYKSHGRFSELNIFNITSDRFNFHLKKLIRDGFIKKTSFTYTLSEQGKEYANRIIKQAKIGVAIHCIRSKNNNLQYLIHKRNKEPFNGWYGSVSGKVLLGESPNEAAFRILKAKSGLKGSFTLKGIAHYVQKHTKEVLLEDEYFWIYKVDNISGKFKKKTKYGENIWMSESEIRELKRVFASFDEMNKFNNSTELIYIDKIKKQKVY
ncbi:MAG: NUDIX domain-containing protein [Patescibacteria group bacterium]